MSQIISVVPNISEGRDEAFIESLQERLERVPGLIVLDVSMDQVRNRTIFSFTGSRQAVFDGGYLLYEMALGHIDMRQHQGEYPRVGAVDVVPFVALRNAPIATAVDWSVQFAEEVARRFEVPVYLFAESARTPPLLAEAGIRYLCDWPNDEQLYAMTVPTGELTALPLRSHRDAGAHPPGHAKEQQRGRERHQAPAQAIDEEPEVDISPSHRGASSAVPA